MMDLRAPCVLKPRRNVEGTAVLYPLLCDSPQALDDALSGLDKSLYFAQEYVRGQATTCAPISRATASTLPSGRKT